MSVGGARDEATAGPQAEPASAFGIGRIFERTHDCVIVANLRGRILLWNPAAERLFGWTAEEVVGEPVSIIIPERLRARHDAGMQRLRRTGRGAYIDAQAPLELPASTRDGREIEVEMTLSKIERDGETFVLAIIREITERARLMRELEAERDALRAANESLEAFAYVVGHDLKEPARGLTAYLDELQEQTRGSPSEDIVRRAVESNERLARMLHGLLAWARTAMTPVEPQPLDVAEVVRIAPCAAYYETLLNERCGRLEVAEDIPQVCGTTALLCQTFGNLVLNSLRHNPAQQPSVHVRAGDASDATHVEVLVEDDGPGFPQAVIQRVHALRNRPSTVSGGFGLAIAQRAVTRLGGTLELENRVEGGGRARVKLPRAVVSERA